MLAVGFCFLFLCFVDSQRAPWPFGLTVFSLLSLFPFFLKSWLVPGGFAWRNHHEKSPQLRGPIGWPVLGTLPEMGSLAHRKLAAMAASLGATRLMAFSLGATRVIISSHPDTAREILSGSSFSDRPIKESARSLMFERAIGFAPSGKYWRHLRRIAANHMFSPKRISGLEELRQRLANEMLVKVREDMEKRGVVILREILEKGSLSNILESVFGRCESVEREELGFMVKEGYELIAKFNWEDYFPVRLLDLYGVKRRCHELASKVNTIVGQIIQARKQNQTDEFNGGNDFLSALLSLPKEDQLTDTNMVAILWVCSISLFLTHSNIHMIRFRHIIWHVLFFINCLEAYNLFNSFSLIISKPQILHKKLDHINFFKKRGWLPMFINNIEFSSSPT